jgi:ParB-like chromosome segregation protein Spo0J
MAVTAEDLPPMERPADHVERRAIASLTPHVGNPREHPPEQIEQIAASMREFGWTIPVLLDELGEIIAGHGRVLAAPPLGWTEAQVTIARGWSEAQKCAYHIAEPFLAPAQP